MPAQINRGFRFVKNLYGGPPLVFSKKLGTGRTVYPGNLIVVGATVPTWMSVAVEASTALAGVVQAYTVMTASQASNVQFIPFLPGYVFECKNTGGMTASKIERFIGSYVDLEIPTATYHRVDTGASSKALMCIGVHPDDWGDTGIDKRLWVTIVPCRSNIVGTDNA